MSANPEMLEPTYCRRLPDPGTYCNLFRAFRKQFSLDLVIIVLVAANWKYSIVKVEGEPQPWFPTLIAFIWITMFFVITLANSLVSEEPHKNIWKAKCRRLVRRLPAERFDVIWAEADLVGKTLEFGLADDHSIVVPLSELRVRETVDESFITIKWVPQNLDVQVLFAKTGSTFGAVLKGPVTYHRPAALNDAGTKRHVFSRRA